MEIKNKKINFLGDSITEGVGTSFIENVYWNVVAKKTGAICRGYGISGTRIAKKSCPSENIKFDKDFVSRVEQMDADADIIVVFGGTNDFGHGDAAIGNINDRTDITFYGALHVLCEKLINRYSDAQIVFMTPLHRMSEDVKINEIGIPCENNLAGYTEIIKEVCDYYAIPVLDLFKISGLQPKVEILRKKYMPDGLHPNDAGNERIADKLIGFLRTL